MATKFLAHLSDQDLISETKRLAAAERVATAALIRSLIELDARRLYLAEGCASLFKYCTDVLHLSEDAAYNRMEVTRTARRFPVILDLLERGALTLTAARRIGPHLTEANANDVLAAAQSKTKREIEELVATLNPQPDLQPVVRELFSLSPERYAVQFTIGRETRDKLAEVQDLLRHSIRTGDLAEIFDRALTLLLKDARRRRFAETDTPRAGRELVPGSRAVPAAVQRAVWKRDERPVHVYRAERALHRNVAPAVASRGSVRRRWASDGRKHPPALCRPQSLRGGVVLCSELPGHRARTPCPMASR